MYQVIIVHNDTRNKNYYFYIDTKGNIDCEDLPPYQDANKARTYYQDTKDENWIYDTGKYAEIIVE